MLRYSDSLEKKWSRTTERRGRRTQRGNACSPRLLRAHSSSLPLVILLMVTTMMLMAMVVMLVDVTVKMMLTLLMTR